MKKGTRYIQGAKRKAHAYAMQLHDNHPDLSCRKMQMLLEEQGYAIDHSTIYRWLRSK